MYPHCLRAYRGGTVAHKTAMSIYDPSPTGRYRVLSLIIVNKVELMLDGVNVMSICITPGSKRAVRSTFACDVGTS